MSEDNQELASSIQKEPIDVAEMHDEPLDPVVPAPGEFNELEVDLDVTVTPASVLQALCILIDQSPDFQLLSAEGVVHAPTFIYRVTVGQLQAQGSGNSKKKAKHSSALCMLKLLLLKLDQNELPKEFTPDSETYLKNYRPVIGNFEYRKQEKVKEEAEDDNPVGKLQELCMKNKHKPPIYLTTEEAGLPHEKTFSITCEVEIEGRMYTALGVGTSKKNAKRTAATAMIDTLKSNNIVDDKEVVGKHNKKAALARRRTADMYDRFESHSDAIDHFCTNIGHDLNLELNDLLTFNDSLDESTHSVETEDYVEKLNTIATYIECNVRFNDFMPLDSDELKYMCFAHLLPFGSGNECLALVTGVGNSKKSKSDAKQKAAKNTLELFNKIRHTSRPFL